MADSKGRASGRLSIDGRSDSGEPADAVEVAGRFQAVINVHDCNLNQIEVAIQANGHEVDPHPILPGAHVERHPVYLVAVDFAHPDQDGNPSEGAPAELNLTLVREVFSVRYPYVSPDPPPSDASHVQVDGMHFIAELDAQGNPTGGVRLGNPEAVG